MFIKNVSYRIGKKKIVPMRIFCPQLKRKNHAIVWCFKGPVSVISSDHPFDKSPVQIQNDTILTFD